MSSTSPDAQTWVFPPAGAVSVPKVVTGDIGPVRLKDSIVLEWSPETKPEIRMTCESDSDERTGEIVAKNAAPPVSYRFENKQVMTNASENIFCHFFFVPSDRGNTIVWKFLNDAGDSPVTWSRAAVSSETSLSSGKEPTTAASTTGTGTTGISTATSPGQAQNDSASSSLSSGAKAGIAVGVTLAAALVGVLLFVILRRHRKESSKLEKTTSTSVPATERWEHFGDPNARRGYMGKPGAPAAIPPAELMGSEARRELP